MPSTCSYCLCTGHSIRTCNSETLDSRWRDIIYRVISARPSRAGLFSEYHIQNARMVLRILPAPILRSISARFCEGRMSYTKTAAIERILGKVEESYEEWRINDQLPVEIEDVQWVEPRFIHDINLEFNSMQSQAQPRTDIHVALLILDDSCDVPDRHCPICFEDQPKSLMLSTGCNHNFCMSCISKYLNQTQAPRCPLCRSNIKTLWARDLDCYDKMSVILNT